MASTEAPHSDDPQRGRPWQQLVLGLFLAAQVLLPLSYYAGRSDPQDDRFAWRMFTDDVAGSCSLRASQDGAVIDLETVVNASWLAAMRYRARPAMAAELQRYLRATSRTGEASLRIVCHDADFRPVLAWDDGPPAGRLGP